jgi:hypothetical protein
MQRLLISHEQEKGLVWLVGGGRKGGFFSSLVRRRSRVLEKRNLNWNSMNAPDEGPSKQLASYQYRFSSPDSYLFFFLFLRLTNPPVFFFLYQYSAFFCSFYTDIYGIGCLQKLYRKCLLALERKLKKCFMT